MEQIWYSHERNQLFVTSGRQTCIFENELGKFLLFYNLSGHKAFVPFQAFYVGKL